MYILTLHKSLKPALNALFANLPAGPHQIIIRLSFFPWIGHVIHMYTKDQILAQTCMNPF